MSVIKSELVARIEGAYGYKCKVVILSGRTLSICHPECRAAAAQDLL
jgi:hypothetical protein